MVNNLDTLSADQKAFVIDTFFDKNGADVTVVTYQDGSIHRGWFDTLADSGVLFQQKKFRLVLQNKTVEYKTEKANGSELDILKEFTQIIEAEKVIDIKRIPLGVDGVIVNPSFDSYLESLKNK